MVGRAGEQSGLRAVVRSFGSRVRRNDRLGIGFPGLAWYASIQGAVKVIVAPTKRSDVGVSREVGGWTHRSWGWLPGFVAHGIEIESFL